MDLARLAGLYPAGVICEVMDEDGTMARGPRLEAVLPRARAEAGHDQGPHPVPDAPRAPGAQDRRGRPAHRLRRVPHPRLREPRSTASTTSRWCMGEISAGGRACAGARPLAVPDRRHLRLAPAATAATSCTRRLEMIARPRAAGVLLYLRQEGRGHRPRPQDHGLPAPGPGQGHGRGQRGARLQAPTSATTASARRSSSSWACSKIRLLTNNPRKFVGLEGYGLEIVGACPSRSPPPTPSRRYLKTKKEKLGPHPAERLTRDPGVPAHVRHLP